MARDTRDTSRARDLTSAIDVLDSPLSGHGSGEFTGTAVVIFDVFGGLDAF